MKKLQVMVDFNGYFAEDGKYIFMALVYYDFFQPNFEILKNLFQ